MIHPTAIIHTGAVLAPDVEVGPCAVVDAGVVVGAGCRLGPHVYLTGETTIGEGNIFHSGCVIGGPSQDLKYKGEPTRLRIGDHNTFREHVTVNRSSGPEEDTVLGDHNLLMACSHVGHNTVIGNFVRLANGALLGGHVTIEDYAIVSGNAMVHQFTRIGTLAMMQGGAGISKDLPPYTMALGNNSICGLNIIGLRRAGFSSSERLELKRAYRFLFRGSLPLRIAAAAAREQFVAGPAAVLVEFVAASKRGVCADIGRVRQHKAEDNAEEN
jgi:UDP-N-acetylglucosamine acyltransferase